MWMYTYKLTGACVSQGRDAGYGTGSSILARLRLTHTEPALAPSTYKQIIDGKDLQLQFTFTQR